MATLHVVGALSPDAIDGKDRHAKMLTEAILAAAKKEGDGEAAVETICGQVFFTSSSSKAIQAVEALFTELGDAEAKVINDLMAISAKSKLSHEAKRRAKTEQKGATQ